MHSNKATRKIRGAITPQRSHGKARVAAVLEAGATVIAEKRHDAATAGLVKFAARAKVPIGSLYRFSPTGEMVYVRWSSVMLFSLTVKPLTAN